MLPRLLDPRSQLERINDEAIGFVSPAELSRRSEQNAKGDRDPERSQLIILQESLWYYRAAIAANATTTLLTAIPTSSTALAGNGISHYIAAPCRLLSVRITSNEDVTAGSITPNLLITEGSDTESVAIDEAALDTTYLNTKATVFDWDIAPQIAGGATIAMRVVTPVGFTPTSADVTVSITLGYARWVS